MVILERSRTVALLIDYDNLQLCAQRDAPGSELDLHSVVALAQRFGTLVVARAYAEWNNPTERLEAYKAGIEPVFAPVLRTEGSAGRDSKSLADTVLVADGVDLMWTHAPGVFVLVTSDKDMIPLARLAKQRGARVVLLGSDLTAVSLRELADDFYTYRRLVHEMTGVLPAGAPGGRPPAGGRAPAVRRPPRREPVAVPSPLPAATEEQPVAAETTSPAPAESPPEERPSPAARRRRRRGGRGRAHPGQAATESAGAEALAGAEQPSATGADESGPPPQLTQPFGAAAIARLQSTGLALEGVPAPAGQEGRGEESGDKPQARPRRRTPRNA